eukprot:846655-Prymnesium_polylepis.1
MREVQSVVTASWSALMQGKRLSNASNRSWIDSQHTAAHLKSIRVARPTTPLQGACTASSRALAHRRALGQNGRMSPAVAPPPQQGNTTRAPDPRSCRRRGSRNCRNLPCPGQRP